jgi:2-amino-4-hydroxy-6-hydroxymethyldihydropteridine diphosphokinase
MAEALIALGGNVGDVRATFARAEAMICGKAQALVLARSSDYRTPPWGDTDQPAFVNACLAVETPLDPFALLHTLKVIETRLGRERDEARRYGPRTIDLDLLAYDDAKIDRDGLTLPHPRLAERAFVLVPLDEIAADRTIAGRTVHAMLADLSVEGIERLPPRP